MSKSDPQSSSNLGSGHQVLGSLRSPSALVYMRCPFDQAICVIAGVVGIAKASNTALMCVASGVSGQKLFSECGRMNKIQARSLHKLYKGGRVSMADFHFSFLQRAVNWQPFTFEHSHSGSSITFFFFFCTNL